jgi:hypothetical protein
MLSQRPRQKTEPVSGSYDRTSKASRGIQSYVVPSVQRPLCRLVVYPHSGQHSPSLFGEFHTFSPIDHELLERPRPKTSAWTWIQRLKTAVLLSYVVLVAAAPYGLCRFLMS